MSRSRILRFLDEVGASSGPSVSLCLPPGLSVQEAEKEIGTRIRVIEKDVLPALAEAVARSRTGAVIFWGESHRVLVIPPFPIVSEVLADGYCVAPLRSILERDLLIALILVRLGDYAIGVFRGEERVSSKVGTGLVHGRHRQGGSSSQRFARHREKQMEYFFERVCGHVREHLEPHVRGLDHVIYGGEEFTLRTFRQQCKFLKYFDERTLNLRLNVRRPRQSSLEEAISEVWSSELIEWAEA
ncbi:MAG: hypothetical protein FJZ95_03220 [Chloroflexi bacterium]|nr:hypothetical protein [Chloroflexota bacterium]